VTLPAALTTATYRVFLSSGADVVGLRNRTERLCQIASEMLSRHECSSRIEIDRWENSPPHVVPTTHLNDEFVRRALTSHVVVALLRAELRTGTLEELEAVLRHGDIEVAVVCFASDQPRSPDLEAFLQRWNNRLLYKEVGPPDSADAWYELVRLVVDLTIQAILGERGSEGYVDRY
jgi:hypothetical protein